MQDFDELSEQIIGAAVDFPCALGVLGGKQVADTRNFKARKQGL